MVKPQPPLPHNTPVQTQKQLSWRDAGLGICLLPLIAGVLLIVDLNFEIIFWDTPERQIVIAVFLILSSFTAAEILRKNWIYFLGWILLMLADWLVLRSLGLGIPVAAILTGALGVILLYWEYCRHWLWKDSLSRE